jgi:hypothetical protein
MAYQNKRGIPIAHSQYIRNGQIIGPAPTIATAAMKPSAEGRAAPVTPGQRSRTVQGHNLARDGAPKNSGAAPVKSGHRNRTAIRE